MLNSLKKLGKMESTERGLVSREAQHTPEEARKEREALERRRGISSKRALTPAEGTVSKEEELKRGSRKGEESAIGEFQLTPHQQKKAR